MSTNQILPSSIDQTALWSSCCPPDGVEENAEAFPGLWGLHEPKPMDTNYFGVKSPHMIFA